MKKFCLGFADEPRRRLVSLSMTGVSFNLTGYKTFSTEIEIELFKVKWKNHFFNKYGSLDKLITVEE